MNPLQKAALAVALFIVGLSSAQESDLSASAMTQKMKAYIGFNEALTPRVQEVNQVFIAKAVAAKKSAAERKEKMGTLKAADAERTAALKAIFNDEEFRKFQEFKKENRKEMKDRLKEKRQVPE